MVLVTVVGELQCKKGFEFVFSGSLSECRDCRVKNVCFHLDENRWYRITDIREVHHDCRIHEGGVRVVEVEKIPSRAAIPSRTALQGSTVTYEAVECDRVGCQNHRLCRPPGTIDGTRFKILSIDRDLDCPVGKSLKAVSLE